MESSKNFSKGTKASSKASRRNEVDEDVAWASEVDGESGSVDDELVNDSSSQSVLRASYECSRNQIDFWNK